jgi:hypothetical protein
VNRLGVVLLVLGLVAIVVGVFPGIAGETAPAEGFGNQQKIAVGVGVLMVVVGLVTACKCGKKACCEAGAAQAAQAPAEPESADEGAAEN